MSSAAEKERVKIGEVGPAWSIWLLLLAACGGGGGGSPKVEVTGISNVDDSPDINDTPEPTHTTDPNLPTEHTVPTDAGNRKTPPPQPISPTSPPPDEPTAPPLSSRILSYGTKDKDKFEGTAEMRSVSYEFSNAGVEISLGAAKNSEGYIIGKGGFANDDQLKDIKNLYGTLYTDTLTGDDDANMIFGLGWLDNLYGLGGDDFLHGGDSADDIEGGAGADTIAGGAGKDVFVLYDVADGVDTITDFTKGEDIIFLYKESVHQPKNLGEAEIRQDRDGDDLIINFEGQTIFILEDHYLSHNRPLLIADFEFLAFETL